MAIAHGHIFAVMRTFWSLLSIWTMHRVPLIFVFLIFGVLAVPSTKQVFVPVSCFFGEPCVLPCHLPKQLFEITWEFDGMPVQWYPKSITLHQHYRFRNRTFLNDHEALKGECSLTIHDMMPQDSGLYKCYLKSQSEREDQLYYNISVNAPVQKVTVVQSGDLLICSSERVHPEPQCRWSDVFSKSSSTVHGDLYSINCTTPLLANVSQYRCTVSTPFNNMSATYIELPPIIFSGTEVMLSCGISSIPVKNVTWRFNNSESIVNQSLEDHRWEVSERWSPFVKNLSESGNLSLKKLTSDHQGLFTCVCSTDTETYTVNVRLEKKGFSNLTIAALIIAALITAALTAFALGTYKCCQVTSEEQPCESQPNLPHCSSSGDRPADRFHLVQLICLFLGLGSVLPGHFLVMALLYIQHRMNFSDQNWMFSLIVLVCQVAHLLSLVVSSCFVPRFTLRKHNAGCLIGIALLFGAMLVFMKVHIVDVETFFGISGCALWLASLFSTMVQRHLSVEVDVLPPGHVSSFAHGQASAGIIASVLMIFFVVTTGDDDSPVFYHFDFAFVVSLLTLLSYYLLPRLEFAKHYFNQQHQIKKEESSLQLLDVNDKKNNDNQEHPQSPDSSSILVCSPPDSKTPNCTKIDFCVMLVQMLTFMVYPAITADIHTKYLGKWQHYFIPVCCFLNFNCFNLIGQKLPFVSRAHKHFKILFPILLVVYTMFIPLFMFSNVQPRTVLHVDAHLSNDAVFAVIMVLFSVINGFLMHPTMFSVANSDNDPGDGRTKIIGRALGSVIGALLSFALREHV